MRNLVVAVVLAATALTGNPSLPGRVVDGSVPESTWDALVAAGWHGDPTDGMEALYR